MKICSVDVDGNFQYEGAMFCVDSRQGKYAPHKTRYGDQYDMDRIICIRKADGGMLFADQDGYLLEEKRITKLR